MDKYALISEYLTRFLEEEVRKTGLSKTVVGLSGGIDSAVVAVLAHRAFGDDLLCVKMPSHHSSQSSLDDADELCRVFGLRSETRSIEPMLRAYGEEGMSALRIGNLSARLRMVTLFDISAREGALVLGTSNKSELMLGYGTLYGDLASALNPIGDLYKTEVFELARHLGIPGSILSKPPSADLWAGQSDEAEIGYPYSDLDRVLKRYVEERHTREEMIRDGEKPDLVDMIIGKIYKNQFKRRMPVIAKLTSRTVNIDFNYPRDITL
ncbi:NAD+ synthase [Sulfuricurvum sp. IAE1]|uniref:NAD+ synthase n=1 Tax=Sulfuricurvum sp. IAE1 TaxID=2546102 RepID=UPI0010444F67|nr:NAD+ synthase [Sulfuricurvum sp. IAE1]TDA64317.1 NAD+ synthase [Sulfuricurvum sp. IAE1]